MAYFGQLYNTHGLFTEGFNLEMVNNAQRFNVFKDAFKEINVENKVVCDLGAGTGLLGLEALDQGAEHVYLIEIDEKTNFYLQSIINSHPLKHKITHITKDICDISITDFKHNVDLFVSETFGGHLYNEGIIKYFSHALNLFPNASTIPWKIGSRFLIAKSDFTDNQIWPQIGNSAIVNGYKTLYHGKINQLGGGSVTIMDQHSLFKTNDLVLSWDCKKYNNEFEYINEFNETDIWFVLIHEIHYTPNFYCGWSNSGWYFKELNNKLKLRYYVQTDLQPVLEITEID
jgi:hypothetical protein